MFFLLKLCFRYSCCLNRIILVEYNTFVCFILIILFPLSVINLFFIEFHDVNIGVDFLTTPPDQFLSRWSNCFAAGINFFLYSCIVSCFGHSDRSRPLLLQPSFYGWGELWARVVERELWGVRVVRSESCEVQELWGARVVRSESCEERELWGARVVRSESCEERELWSFNTYDTCS